MADSWPSLTGDDWTVTRNILHRYMQVVGEIRAQLAPRQKHWWHIGLLPSLNGFSTGTLRQNGKSFSIEVDLQESRLILSFQGKEPTYVSLHGQSSSLLWNQLRDVLSAHSIHVEINSSTINSDENSGYVPEQDRWDFIRE